MRRQWVKESSLRGAPGGGNRLSPRPCWHCPQDLGSLGNKGHSPPLKHIRRGCGESFSPKVLFPLSKQAVIHFRRAVRLPALCHQPPPSDRRLHFSGVGMPPHHGLGSLDRLLRDSITLPDSIRYLQRELFAKF